MQLFTNTFSIGFLPMKDRANYLAFNPTGIACPSAVSWGNRYQVISWGMSTRPARCVARSPRRARRVDQ